MKLQDFRPFLITQLRAYDSWAWKDHLEYPQDYENLTFEDYMNNLKEFIKGNTSD